MLRTFFKSKIHRATVSSVNINYEGSLTIDSALMEACEINEFEQIHVLNINNGNRFVTYAIKGEKDSGEIQVNGAAAHLCKTGDLLIIITYGQFNNDELLNFNPKVVYVNEKNKITEISKKNYVK